MRVKAQIVEVYFCCVCGTKEVFRWIILVFVVYLEPATLDGQIVNKVQFEALHHAMKQLEVFNYFVNSVDLHSLI